LIAAFSSLSRTSPQAEQRNVRSFNPAKPLTAALRQPQPEQSWVEGKKRSATTTAEPYQSAL